MFSGNEIFTAADRRKQDGLAIASLAKIEKVNGFYLVPSITAPRPTRYKIGIDGNDFSCNCPDYETTRDKCKHIHAVEATVSGEQLTAPTTNYPANSRKTYRQDWKAYNAAQQNEKRVFQTLLASLCKDITGRGDKPSRGRPTFPLNDAIFSAVYKVYSTFSGRRFTSDLCDAKSKGFIGKVPHYNTVFRCIEDPNLFPILLDLITRSSLPLKSIESAFAVDSTGFAYSRFVRWYDIKYNRFTARQQWVKAHLMCGVKTNVVTAVEIHNRDTNDAPILPSLVDATARNFNLSEVSADKGYSSKANHEAIARNNATPYIAFKNTATGGIGGMFEKMWHYFSLNRDTFLAHYHQRSNIESTMMMIKTKFGDSVRSKSEVAAKNEVLAKILCHNICCLISAMYELGIQPIFNDLTKE